MTHTIADAIETSAILLRDAGCDTPRLDSQLLLAWVCKCRREDLAREPEHILSDREALIFDKAVQLRCERRPLPYITGEQSFYGRSFKINRAVLIPRPETELLVEATLRRISEFESPRILDVGFGSGCIAVTLACERSDAQVWATDISVNARKEARKNVARYAVADRVHLLLGDLMTPVPPELRFNVIVSNPPYIPTNDWPDLQPEVREYEPPEALIGLRGAAGVDGMVLHRRLMLEARNRLTPDGCLLMEVGHDQAEKVAATAMSLGYRDIHIESDLAGIGRVVEMSDFQ